MALLAGYPATAQTLEDASPLHAASSPAAFAEVAASAPLFVRPVLVDKVTEGSSSSVNSGLPEDPGARLVASGGLDFQDNGTPQRATTAGPVAPIHRKYIPAGWAAQSLTARDKVLIGVQDLYRPSNFAAKIIAAGYEQVENGQPNYGVDRGAYGERLGAAGIREATQGLFTDSVFSPLFHEDSRYYVEGRQYGLFHRTIYAITRPLITRKDNGHSSINAALLLGYAASSGLTYAYYPSINRNIKDTADTFGGGIGGAALGFFVSEFSADALVVLHIKKAE